MNKTLTISVIALVAVVMGFSTVAPALQQAFAHDVTEAKGRIGLGECPRGFSEGTTDIPGTHPDHNFNGVVCRNSVGGAIVDDNVPAFAGRR